MQIKSPLWAPSSAAFNAFGRASDHLCPVQKDFTFIMAPVEEIITDLVEQFTSWFIANARILIISELISHIALISIWF